MAQFKIPTQTLNRKPKDQTFAVELANAVPCPRCKAKAGFYCISNTGNKLNSYHQVRFEAYVRKSKHYHPKAKPSQTLKV